MNSFKVFCGRYGQEIAKRVCADQILNMHLGRCKTDRFSDGEIQIEFEEEVRGEEVYVIQPLINSDAIVELGIMVDAACRSSAQSIIAVLPYMGYARQERKSRPRVPISAKWLVDMLINSGADRIVTVDLHAAAIQGFVNARYGFDNLYAGMAICNFFKDIYERKGINIQKDVFSVAPDNGSAERVRALSDRLGIETRVIIDKRRSMPNDTKLMNVIGKFEKDQRALILDDMLDTASTAVNAAIMLHSLGASAVDIGVTHGIISGKAKSRLEQCAVIENIVITDTYPLTQERNLDKIHVISIAPMLAQAIKNLNRQMSLSVLFDRAPPYLVLQQKKD
ncbi:MAG TPA: ribose-phosphate diphosphokinase [Candidatus Uhrbacteria bacterium]|nr:ribose-phosphate diphosphokinase [Candidatus Uhrbacteria bacterium]